MLSTIKQQIRSFLTIGRMDNSLEPLSQKTINDFISKNIKKIEHIAYTMFVEYKQDGELQLFLDDPRFSRVREYMWGTFPELEAVLGY